MSTQWQIDPARIIYETIDNETLLIDSATGFYYVLKESGAEIWQLLTQGVDTATLLEQLAQRYTRPVAELQPLVQPFLDELQAAELVTWQPTPTADRPRLPINHPAQSEPASTTFVAPKLHSFSDMHELLLMDPIHEVAATGWPFTPADEKSSKLHERF